MINQRQLKDLLNYTPETGLFVWKINRNAIRIGDPAGWVTNRGYISIMINEVSYLAHRLAWLYVHGDLPLDGIDHINHICDDNRISNLRSVSHQENCKNKSLSKNNSSGITGVSWHKRDQKWQAYIKIDYKNKHLGSFNNIEDAISARKKANILHNFHDNHGEQHEK